MVTFSQISPVLEKKDFRQISMVHLCCSIGFAKARNKVVARVRFAVNHSRKTNVLKRIISILTAQTMRRETYNGYVRLVISVFTIRLAEEKRLKREFPPGWNRFPPSSLSERR